MAESGRPELAALKQRVDPAAFARDRYGVEFDANGKARCPHAERHNNGDRNPSFQLHKARFKCWSRGCFGEKPVDVFGLVMDMDGVGLADARRIVEKYAGVNGGGTSGTPQPRRSGPSKRVKTKRTPEVQALIRGPFQYYNRAGELLFTIARTDQANGDKSFFCAPKGYPKDERVIYRWIELEAGEDPVILPEGEGKADVLGSLGYTATATPFGSGSWLAPYADALQGRHVILWPDNDNAGRTYAEAAARDLLPVVASLRIVEAPDWLSKGEDVVDVLEARGEAEVRRLVEAAVPWEPPEGPEQAEPEPNPAERSTVAMCDVEPTESKWLSHPRIELETLTLVFGAGGDGKTYACCAIMAALSKGEGLWGAEGTRVPSTCIYMTGEDSLQMLRRRLDAMDANVNFIRGYDEPFSFDAEGFAFVEREIEDHGAELCVIDPVVAFLGKDLDMYRANETRAVLSPLKDVAKRTGAAIIIVTHVTKGAANRAVSRALGSADFGNAARSALLVGSDPDNPRRKALCQVKVNNAALADPVGFEIDQAGRFTWTQGTDLTSARILGAEAGDDERQAGTQAEELLRAECKEERKAADVIDQAKLEGIAQRTIQRAAGRMCEHRREGFGKGSVVYWKLKPEHIDAT